MNGSARIINAYAQAYIAASSASPITPMDVENFKKFHAYCVAHPQLEVYLTLPLLKKEYTTFITTAAKLFNLPATWIRLGTLLQKHNRVGLLSAVSNNIATLVLEKNNILSCIISTAHRLESTQITQAAHFFETITKKQVQYTTAVNPHLIAGMRIQSATLRWEDSVQKRLRAAAKLTM